MIDLSHWSQQLENDSVLSNSTNCEEFESFQYSLYGENTLNITVSSGNSSFSCSNLSVTNEILDAFTKCSREFCFREEKAFDCQGVIWRIGDCDGVEISVGGSGICKCDGSATIRPCSQNSTRGGSAGDTCSTVAQLQSINVTRLIGNL